MMIVILISMTELQIQDNWNKCDSYQSFAFYKQIIIGQMMWNCNETLKNILLLWHQNSVVNIRYIEVSNGTMMTALCHYGVFFLDKMWHISDLVSMMDVIGFSG